MLTSAFSLDEALLLAFWISIWWVDRCLWVAFGLLCATHATLSILAHREAARAR